MIFRVDYKKTVCMEKAFEFLKKNKDVAFATVEDNKPKIRVFQIMKQEDHILYFATTSHKEVYQQLKKNPNVEILAMSGNISVRIRGKVIFDVPNDIAKDIYSHNAVLPRLYKSYQDLVYFRLPIDLLDYFDLSFTPPLFKHFENNSLLTNNGENNNV